MFFFIKNVACYDVIMNSGERSESTNLGIRFTYMDKRGKFYLHDYCKLKQKSLIIDCFKFHYAEKKNVSSTCVSR